jgi:SAM-dependent methyltransferase
MDERPDQSTGNASGERPSVARMYDYYLGRSNNLAADRRLALDHLRVLPDMPVIARAQRQALRRMVRHLVRCGVDQFLDLGCGMPGTDNVHEFARAVIPSARVVYVDADPVAAAHGMRRFAVAGLTGVIMADLRDPAGVLEHPVLRKVLDLSRPVAVLMASVLHFLADRDDPGAVVEQYRRATVPGSYLALIHATDDYDPETARRAEEVYRRASHQLRHRSWAAIGKLLGGYELVEPGLVDMTHWRPEPGDGPDPLGGDVARYSGYAAVGRNPG